MCDKKTFAQAVLSCNITELTRHINIIKDVNFKIPSTYGLTLLHIAAGIPFHKSGPTVHYLLKANADPNARSQDGLTPVHIAAMWDNIFVLEQLLFYGGNPFLKDYDNQDALDMALENNAKKCYRYLKSSKLDKESLITMLKEELSLRTNLKSFHSDIDLFSLCSTNGDVKEAMSSNDLNRNSLKVFNAAEDECFRPSNIFEDSDSDIAKDVASLVEGDTSSSCDSFVSCTSRSPKTLNSYIGISPKAFNSRIRISPKSAGSTTKDSPKSVFFSVDESLKFLDSMVKTSPRATDSRIEIDEPDCGNSKLPIIEESKSSDCLVGGSHSVPEVSNFNRVKDWIKSVNCCKKPTQNFSIELLNAQLSEIMAGNGYDLTNDAITCISECSDNDIEITYADEIEGISLIERRVLSVPPNSVASSLQSVGDYDSQCDWKFYKSSYSDPSIVSHYEVQHIYVPEELQLLSNDEIYVQLRELGDRPGPIMECTRDVYLRRLTELKFGTVSPAVEEVEKYPPEIYMFLSKELDIEKLRELEINFVAEIEKVSLTGECREGNQRCSFNYFLLDPRVTQNLPLKVLTMSKTEAFNIFLDALFYVGKGTRGRPFCHLYEAAKVAKSGNTAKVNDKVKHILDIWNSGQGVVSLHCFQNAIPIEAFTREASIIEAIGLSNLTNIQKGNFYGQVAKWTKSKKRRLGVLLLARAFEIFLQEGERLIRPKDIKR